MTDYTEIINSRKDLPGGLIEAYHAIQREYNYIPEEAVREAAQVFGLPLAKAFGVATFYSYLKVGQRGKYVIRICASAPCHIAGASEVVDALEKELGIKWEKPRRTENLPWSGRNVWGSARIPGVYGEWQTLWRIEQGANIPGSVPV